MSRGLVNLLLALVVALGVVWLVLLPPGLILRAEPRALGPAPRPVIGTNAFGAPEARVDVAALTAWCARSRLPPPPPLTAYEPEVAAALLDAYEAVAREPSSGAWERLGMVLAAVDAGPSADFAFVEAERRFATPKETRARLAHFRGVLAMQAGDVERARELLVRASRLHEPSASTWGRLAHLTLDEVEADDDVATREGLQRAADFQLEQFERFAPKDALVWVLRSRQALLRGDGPAAHEHALRALAVEAPTFQSLHALGRARAALGDETGAALAYTAADALPQGAVFNARDPWVQEWYRAAGATRALVQRFEALQGGDDLAGLIALGESIVQRRPDDATMLGNLAELYRKTRRFDEADAALDRALARAPGASHLHTKRATLRLAEGRHAEAVAAADAALALHDGDARAWSVKGRAQYLAGEPLAAESSLRRAVALQPDDVSTLLVLVTVLESLGRGPEACPLLDQALQHAPGLPAALDAKQRLGCP